MHRRYSITKSRHSGGKGNGVLRVLVVKRAPKLRSRNVLAVLFD